MDVFGESASVRNEPDGDRVAVGLPAIRCHGGNNTENNVEHSDDWNDDDSNDQPGGEKSHHEAPENGELKVERRAGVVSNERPAIPENEIADERRKKVEKDPTDVNEGGPELLVSDGQWLCFRR